MSDYRHAATRKNNPPAKIAAEGTVPVVSKAQYAYNAHLPPVLRFDPGGRPDALQAFLGNPWIRGFVFLVAGLIGLYAIMEWLNGGGTLADVGPELIGVLFGLMFSFGARRNP